MSSPKPWTVISNPLPASVASMSTRISASKNGDDTGTIVAIGTGGSVASSSPGAGSILSNVTR